MAETDLVELVDDGGRATGRCSVAAAHRAPGLRHRAFSVVIHDGSGSVLLQQRAAAKTRFGGAWANSCCGHPEPGEPVADAAARRTAEELGVALTGFEPAGVHVYDAVDDGSGMVECEYDHVLVVEADRALELRPDPGEVTELRWLPLAGLLADPASLPGPSAPWLYGVLSVAARHLAATPRHSP